MGLSDNQVSEFQQNGFVVVKGFFGPGDMKRVSEWLDDLAAKDGDMRAQYYAAKAKSYPANDASMARAPESFRV